MSTYEKIYEHICSLKIIDTHEHLPAFEKLRDRETDVLKEYLTHYFNCDLISSGLSEEEFEKAVNCSLPLMERWKLVEPYWELCRYTGYGRSLDIAARDLYGCGPITGDTIEELNEKFLESLKEGHYRKVLKEKSKIAVSLLHNVSKVQDKIVFTSNIESDPLYFRNVYPIDGHVFPQEIDDIQRIAQEAGIPVSSCTDWLEAAEKCMDNALEHGAVGFKSALAYQRPLSYESAPFYKAEEEFNRLLQFSHMKTYLPSAFQTSKEFQDYMMHFILGYADKKGLTVQFHTGLQEGNGNLIYHSDPTLLSPLFLRYRNVRFDLFHMGYPYHHLVSAPAKNFPNVYIDMCWAHIISPEASINALEEWLDSVPINKISAFGGDYLFVDGVYGHQYLARENVAKALTRKIEKGAMDPDTAKMISDKLFYHNPKELFQLDISE